MGLQVVGVFQLQSRPEEDDSPGQPRVQLRANFIPRAESSTANQSLLCARH